MMLGKKKGHFVQNAWTVVKKPRECQKDLMMIIGDAQYVIAV